MINIARHHLGCHNKASTFTEGLSASTKQWYLCNRLDCGGEQNAYILLSTCKKSTCAATRGRTKREKTSPTVRTFNALYLDLVSKQKITLSALRSALASVALSAGMKG